MSSWFRRLDLAHTESTSLANKGVLSTASVAIQGVVRSVYSILIGNLLTPALLAAVNSAISLALFVSLLWPSAAGNAAAKFIARSRGAGDLEQIGQIAAHLRRVTLLSSFALAIPAGVFSWFFQARHDTLTAVLVMFLVVAWSGYSLARGVLFATGQIARSLIWDTISAVAALVLLAGVLVAGWTGILLLPLAIGYLIYAIAGWPPANAATRGLATPLPHILKTEINRFTLWSMIGILASTGLLQLTMIIAQAPGVGHGTDAGMYAAALTLATPASMLASALSLVLFPSMAHAIGQGNLARVRQQTDAATRGLILVAGGLFAVLILLSRPIIDIIWGARYADAVAILPILLAASMLITVNVGATNALSATTSLGVRTPAMFSVAGLIVGLIMIFVLVPSLGVSGVAWGYLAGAIVNGLGPILFVWRRERMPWAGLLGRAALGAVVVVAVVLGREWLHAGYWGDAAATIVFLAAWALLMRKELVMLNSVRKLSAR